MAADTIGTIHVVMACDTGDNQSALYYLKYNGLTWSVPTAFFIAGLSGDFNYWYPHLAIDNRGYLHITWIYQWYDYVLNGPCYQLCYSYFNGTTWSSPEILDENFKMGLAPNNIVCNASNYPQIFWVRRIVISPGEYYCLYYRQKGSNGFSPEVPISTRGDGMITYNLDFSNIRTPAKAFGDNLHVVWEGLYNGWSEIVHNYASISTDNTPPIITVSSPSTGENLSVGLNYPIHWIATDDVYVSSVTLSCSYDGGSTFTIITSGIANTGSYTWHVPNYTTSSAQIRITALDGSGNEGVGFSGVFNLGDFTPPVITLSSPTGGESWQAYSQKTIRWVAIDNVGVSTVQLYYSTSIGGEWYVISSTEQNTGSYIWTVPANYSNSCYVKVIAIDSVGNSTYALNSIAFAIVEGNHPPYEPHSPSPVDGGTMEIMSPKLEWSGGDPDTSDTVTYDVYLGLSPTLFPDDLIASGITTTSVIPAGLTSGLTYYWKVVGNDSYTRITSAVWSFLVIEPILQPTALSVNVNTSGGSFGSPLKRPMLQSSDMKQIDLIWEDNATNETGYRIERKTDIDGAYSEVATVGVDVTTYSDESAEAGNVYVYRVSAFSSVATSANSNEAATSTGNHPPNVPINPFPADSTSSISVFTTFGWTGGDPDAGDFVTYDIFVGADTTKELILWQSDVGTTNFQPILPLMYNQPYIWKIIARDNIGEESEGSLWTFTTETETLPVSPSDLELLSLDTSTVTIIWTDNSNNEIGFKVERKLSSDTAYLQIAIVDTPYFVDTTAAVPGTTYDYRIRAYNNAGDSGYTEIQGVSVILSRFEAILEE